MAGARLRGRKLGHREVTPAQEALWRQGLLPQTRHRGPEVSLGLSGTLLCLSLKPGAVGRSRDGVAGSVVGLPVQVPIRTLEVGFQP